MDGLLDRCAIKAKSMNLKVFGVANYGTFLLPFMFNVKDLKVREKAGKTI